jgi:hypothetical protein
MGHSEIGWEKRTPKSDKIDRQRCQHERYPARKAHPGVPSGSGKTDYGGEAIFT